MTEATPKARETPPEMAGVRTLDTPALVSPDCRVPLRVWVPDTAAREAAPDSLKPSKQWMTALGVLASRKARECGYRVRQVHGYEHDADGYTVTLEVDADV